jgi:4-hydroxymandelate oxidase
VSGERRPASVPEPRRPGPVTPLLTIDEYARAARELLPPAVWDYLAGGSGAETTVRANRAAFDALALRPRVLVDVSRLDRATTLLGAPVAAPIAVAPTAYHRLAHPAGEVATAQAAGAAGLLMVVSVFASRTLAEIAAAATGPLWLQLYWFRQRELLVDLAARAEAAGYRALVLTVDAPRMGRRLRDLRHGFALPPGVVAANLDPAVVAGQDRSRAGESALARHAREQFDPTITWDDLGWLQQQTRLPVVLKGVLTAEDARLAVAHGLAGVIVSNHGGRQLDGAVPSLEALPEVVEAVAGQCPVLVDGGVRTGADVVKALARGACAVLVGRPVLWGLATTGAAGAQAVLDLLVTELEDAMALTGLPRLADIGPAALTRLPAAP